MENRLRAYISGPISALDYKEALENFANCETRLRELGITQIFNPMVEVDPTLPYRVQMEQCLQALETCDLIIMLRDWTQSPGACEEFVRAQKLKIIIRHDRNAEYKDIQMFILPKYRKHEHV